MLSMYFSLRQIYLQFKRFLQSLFSFSKKTNTRRIFVFTKKNKNYLFHSRFSVYLFISTYLFKQQQQLSGRDIICFPPNALFISGRDFVQSFESRHGRHGNSNLVMLFVSERNNHWRNKQKNKGIIYWLSTYIIAAAVSVLSARCNRSSKNTKCCAIIINRWFFFF